VDLLLGPPAARRELCHAHLERVDERNLLLVGRNGVEIGDDSGTVDGKAFKGPRELAAVLRATPAVTACLARQIYRYATGHIETPGEGAVLTGVDARAQAAGNAFLDYLGAVAASDGFRYAGSAP